MLIAASAAASTQFAPSIRELPPSGNTVWILTRTGCAEGRVVRREATAIDLQPLAADRPGRVLDRIEAEDILAVVRRQRGGTPWDRIAGSVALGAGAAVAAANDRSWAAAALGFSAWLVPWWGWDERGHATLVYAAAGVRPPRPSPGSSRCEVLMYEALRRR
jgi:hypothetical protein